MIKCHSDTLDVPHLPSEILSGPKGPSKGLRGRRPKLDQSSVADALRRAGGNRVRAARLLEVSRTTLYRFLEQHPQLPGIH
jgi:transcriptional regulator of acetoin/glycerol metabolism